jgi:hypothetical protein
LDDVLDGNTTIQQQQRGTDMDTKKMRACAPLLPAPGDSVVIECLDEIERLRLQHDPRVLATRFHETYERLAPAFGYETRPDTKVFDPESKNGRLMVAVCAELMPMRPNP